MIPAVTQHPSRLNQFCTSTLEEESASDVAKRVAERATQQLGCAISREDVRFVEVGETGESVYEVRGWGEDGQPTRRVAVTLTAYNMGDVNEDDFDAWARYVEEHLGEKLVGVAVRDVSQFVFGHGPDRDHVACDCPAGCECDGSVRDALRVLWDDFCADDSAWPNADESHP